MSSLKTHYRNRWTVDMPYTNRDEFADDLESASDKLKIAQDTISEHLFNYKALKAIKERHIDWALFMLYDFWSYIYESNVLPEEGTEGWNLFEKLDDLFRSGRPNSKSLDEDQRHNFASIYLDAILKYVLPMPDWLEENDCHESDPAIIDNILDGIDEIKALMYGYNFIWSNELYHDYPWSDGFSYYLYSVSNEQRQLIMRNLEKGRDAFDGLSPGVDFPCYWRANPNIQESNAQSWNFSVSSHVYRRISFLVLGRYEKPNVITKSPTMTDPGAILTEYMNGADYREFDSSMGKIMISSNKDHAGYHRGYILQLEDGTLVTYHMKKLYQGMKDPKQKEVLDIILSDMIEAAAI